MLFFFADDNNSTNDNSDKETNDGYDPEGDDTPAGSGTPDTDDDLVQDLLSRLQQASEEKTRIEKDAQFRINAKDQEFREARAKWDEERNNLLTG